MRTPNLFVQTSGHSNWSDRKQATVKIHSIELVAYDAADPSEWPEVRVHFTRRSWDVDEHGLIYTDHGFERELRKALIARGIPAKRLSFTEQGMQGDDYVSMYAGSKRCAFYKAVNGRKSL